MQKTQLWREGLIVFSQRLRVWREWAVVFIVILVPFEFVTLLDSGPANAALLDMIRTLSIHVPPDAVAKMKDASAQSLPVWVSTLSPWLIVVIYLIADYCFCGLYLRHAPVVAKPVMNMGGFFYALGQAILRYLAITGWCFLLMIPGSILCAIVIAVGLIVLGKAHEAAAFVGFLCGGLIVVCMFASMAYFALRYVFVFILAVERVPSSLKVSVQLMRGNMWRMAKDFFILFLITLPLSVISYGGVFGCAILGNYWENPSITGVLAVLLSASVIGLSGVYSAFLCTAARILYQEKQQADPLFELQAQQAS